MTLSSDVLGLEMIGLLLVGLIAGLAASLRSADDRRNVAISETRRSERLAIVFVPAVPAGGVAPAAAR